ncbi:PAS domain-containing protein [Bradyrhizobium prioriisuperbiae]|uniref:PAS domain-containing protein n=1 Tax=Bradyrhizobium prioriisuperbiae TaxID=2854389 RepID=UPI0028EBFC67|nr:PAS domain-containing protein [Bradyrhizobium prioritasuperba]
MPINEAEFQVRGVRDPQLADHATSALPVWLWASDGTRILWANPAGAAIFGARNSTALAARTFGPADQHRRQVARLAGHLALNGAPRLERLRGFGTALGLLVTCACARLVFTGGGIGILVAALAPVGRTIAYDDRVERLVDDIDAPVAAFAREGGLIAANRTAVPLFTANLAGLGLDAARHDALRDGRANAKISIGHVELYRVGQGAETTLLAFVTPVAQAPAATVSTVEAADEQGLDIAAGSPPWPLQSLDDLESSPASTPQPIAVIPQAVPAAARSLDAPPAVQAGAIPARDGADTIMTAADVAPRLQALADRLAEFAGWKTTAPVEASASRHDAIITPASPATVDSPSQGDPVQRPTDSPRENEIASPIVPWDTVADIATPDVPAAFQKLADRLAEVAGSTDAPSSEHLVEVPSSEPVALDGAAPVIIPEPPVPPATVDDPSDTPADRPREPHAANPDVPSQAAEEAPTAVLPLLDEQPLTARRHPLRFRWQMDAEGRFSLGSDEFSRLIGPRTATAFGRLWSEIAEVFGLDPGGQVQAAIATRDTWSGITVNWPADDAGGRLPVELSGLPVYDRNKKFSGYRGFGVCRDLEALANLAAQRRHDALHPAPLLRETQAMTHDFGTNDIRAKDSAPDIALSSPSTETDHPVESPPNVVPFRPATDLKTPTLTPVENNAFNELARQLASRLDTERLELDARDKAPVISPELFADAAVDPDVAPPGDQPASTPTATSDNQRAAPLHAPMPPPQGESRRDTLLYDRIPVGILIYRLDRLLYANKAFLDRVGYADLQALAAAGGLDALYVEPGVDGGGSVSDEGTPVKIAATGHGDMPTEARLHSMSWDGDAAHALIFAAPHTKPAGTAPIAAPPAAIPIVPTAEIDTRAEELGTILDATDDGILIFGADGGILTCNRGAEILFGHDDRDIVQHNLTDMFAPDDHAAVRDDFAGLKAGHRPQCRKVRGRARNGDTPALSLTIGRTTANGERFFAICRTLAPSGIAEAQRAEAPAAESDTTAKRQTERAANARADILARISHEVRTPLNSIIGFTDVMIEERFGALGNERYVAYMRDIRAAGERVLAIISDLLDLSRAETGKLDLTFARQDLNDMVEKCVTIMQPQANRERIIIRTSLAHALPPVTADASALRQIVLNLVGNSIHVARAGGQVIVSTALTDLGDVVLRIRDTGRGLNHSEMEAALEQFRQPASDQLAQDNVGINLSLTRALVEANQAQFHIKSAPQSGTLVEVAFTPKTAQAV